jgi:hypothetical protein
MKVLRPVFPKLSFKRIRDLNENYLAVLLLAGAVRTAELSCHKPVVQGVEADKDGREEVFGGIGPISL